MPSAIPTIVNPEIAVDPDSNAAPNLILRGAKEGAIVALQLALGYALLLAVGIPFWDIIETGWTSYSASSFGISIPVFVMASVLGSIPTLIIGAMGGAIIGMLFRQLPKQTMLSVSLTMGMIGGALLLAPLTLVAAFLFFREDMSQGTLASFGMVWGFPALVALLGFARVGHRLNIILPDTPTHE